MESDMAWGNQEEEVGHCQKKLESFRCPSQFILSQLHLGPAPSPGEGVSPWGLSKRFMQWEGSTWAFLCRGGIICQDEVWRGWSTTTLLSW